MTEALHTRAAGTADPADAVSEHAAWRAARERELREPHGWLSLTALVWPTAKPGRLPGVPGEWWVADGILYTRPVPGDTAVLVGERVEPDGPTAVGVGEGRSRIVGTFVPADREGSADDAEVAVEVVVRTGRYGVRLRDPRAATRTGFTDVPAFGYDPAWVLDAPVRWYDEPESVTVGSAQPGLVHDVEVFGEVDLVHGGRSATLALTGTLTSPTIVFSDETDGVAPWRALVVTTSDQADDQAADETDDETDEADISVPRTLRLDLNRVVNLPHAFTDFATSAAPLRGNHLPFAVTAGEQAPR